MSVSVIPTSQVTMEKQEFELHAVRMLRQAGGLDHGSELQLGSDPPDVIAKIGEMRIGIEVRRLFNDERRSGSLSRQRLSTCQAVVDSAARLHSQVSSRSIQVSVHFCKGVVIPSSRKNVIAKMLVDLISRMSLRVGEAFHLRSEDSWGPHWPEEILYVSGVLLEGVGHSFWGLSDSAWVGMTSNELIQSALRTKELDLPRWRNEVCEAWILMVLDGSVESSMLRIHEEISAVEYASYFDHAFVMEFCAMTVKKLSLTPLLKPGITSL